MKRGAVETILGGFVLVIAIGFAVMGARSIDLRGDDGYELSARFLKVGGLDRGSDVRISGVKVGSVIDRKLDDVTFEAVVTFTVRGDINLPADTEAGVTAEGLLGGKYLRLFPGRSKETLAPNGEIARTRDFQALEDTVSEIIFLATGSR
ncbi:MAG: outer membrane lipid asymmetry maintenance protein MlaD [Alphaproteobacteria bacterium]|mgnify:CR=1 FL=1|nr:outer membrane lipid asymmetry maintenance protein MlaD [Alphaproteobacteria bacterium]HCP00771.1 outer membrane lipid asymmetry maintenance protein MlaD [Rhodospirillaceae bacterium]